MRKNYLFKSLFVAALAMSSLGASAAAGDVTTNANIDFSNAITDNAVAGTVGSMSIGSGCSISGGHLVLASTTSTVSTNTVSIAEADRAGANDKVTVSFDLAFGLLSGKSVGFSMVDADGTSIASFSFIPKSPALTTNLGVLKDDMYYGYSTVIWDRKVSFTIVFDYTMKTITTSTSCYKSGINKAVTAASHTVTMTNTNPVAAFNVFSDYTTNKNNCEFDNLIITTTEGVAQQTANYTINYILNDDGSSVKTSATRTGVVGSSILLTNADIADFTNDETTQKYIYVSNDLGEKTVAENGSSVVNITFKKAVKYNYTVKSDQGDVVIASGSDWEGNKISVAYPLYQLVGSELYYKNAISSQYSYSFTLSSDNQVETLAYTDANIGNVAYYSEGENIDGVTVVNSGNTASRSSNAKGGYNGTNSNIQFATLPAGNYKLTVVTGGGGTSSSNPNVFYAGENLIMSPAFSGNWTSNNVYFTLESSTNLYIAPFGSATKNIDFLYIQNASDAISMTSARYATFCSSNAIDFSGVKGLTAYAATAYDATAGTLTLTQVSNAPANTPLILAGDAGTSYTLPWTSSATDPITTNELTAATSAFTVPTDDTSNKYYVLAKENGVVGFYPAAKGLVISKGKAYMKVATSGSAKVAGFTFDFDGTTGINEVSAKTASDSAFYNLQGVKVQNPVKGLYINNGKKVIIK